MPRCVPPPDACERLPHPRGPDQRARVRGVALPMLLQALFRRSRGANASPQLLLREQGAKRSPVGLGGVQGRAMHRWLAIQTCAFQCWGVA